MTNPRVELGDKQLIEINLVDRPRVRIPHRPRLTTDGKWLVSFGDFTVTIDPKAIRATQF